LEASQHFLFYSVELLAAHPTPIPGDIITTILKNDHVEKSTDMDHGGFTKLT